MIYWFFNQNFLMNHRISILLLAFILFNPLFTSAQELVSPLVSDYGLIYNIRGSVKPDPSISYQIVADVSTKSGKAKYINQGLYNLARLVNLHIAGGVDPSKLQVVAAIHGGATFATLDNNGYNEKYGMDNPNIELIQQLKDAGVQLFVCGQSLVIRNDGLENVNPQVDISLSAMTIVTEYQAKGYGLLKFD